MKGKKHVGDIGCGSSYMLSGALRDDCAAGHVRMHGLRDKKVHVSRENSTLVRNVMWLRNPKMVSTARVCCTRQQR